MSRGGGRGRPTEKQRTHVLARSHTVAVSRLKEREHCVDANFEVSSLVEAVDMASKEELSRKPEVESSWSGDLDVSKLPIDKRLWQEVPDLVAVVADLKNSTKMGTGKHAASTASIYEASTGGVVEVFNRFEANFIQIQGDGAFALFWDDGRLERAVCAAITVQTFGTKLQSRLESKWPEAPVTGLKVGVAASRVLVKRVGTPRNPSQQEPIWAGKAVNYAMKAAQSADAGQLIVTGTVWDAIAGNDYLTISCGCSAGEVSSPRPLWDDVEIRRLPEDDPDSAGRLLRSTWCPLHGDEFCQAVLTGETTRPSVEAERSGVLASQKRDSLRLVKEAQRKLVRERKRGLARR